MPLDLSGVGDAAGEAWLWFNTSRVAATAAAAGATAAVFGAVAAVRSFGQTRRDSKARSRPIIAAELRDVPYVDATQVLVIKNYGSTMARNVRVAFEPAIVIPDDGTKYIAKFLVARYSKPIAVMTPGMELDNIYFSGRAGDDGRWVNREPVPEQVTVTITYETGDERRDTYTDRFPLDTGLIRDRTYVTSSRDPESQAKEALGSLKKLSEGLTDLAKSGRLITKVERQSEAAHQRDAYEKLSNALLPADNDCTAGSPSPEDQLATGSSGSSGGNGVGARDQTPGADGGWRHRFWTRARRTGPQDIGAGGD